MSVSSPKLYAALALCAVAGYASAAGQASIGFDQLGPALELSTSETDDYLTGPMQFKDVHGKSFVAYCVELAQDHAELGDGLQSYTIGSFGGAQAHALQGLFSTSFAGLGNATQQAAFQMAVWEITHETASSFSVSKNAGVFYFNNLTQGDADANLAFTNLVNGYLNAAVNYSGPALYQINKLSHADYQDLLTVTAVPEPGTYAMLLAGLGVVGFVARRRQRKG